MTQAAQGLAHNKCSTTEVIFNSSTGKMNPVSRTVVIIGGQSPWKYQNKNQKRMEGISLHNHAIWEETLHPQADTYTAWPPPTSCCWLLPLGLAHTFPKHPTSAGLEGPGPKHLLFKLRNPRTGESIDVLKSTQPAVLFHSQVKQLMKSLIRYIFYNSSFLVTQNKKIKPESECSTHQLS